MAQLQAPAPRRPIALLRKRRTSSHQARALHSGSIADATPSSSSTSTGENEVRADAQPDEEEDGENRNRPVMRQRRSASPVAGSHLALSASTNHADGTPSRHDRDRLLSVPLARSHAASNEGLGTPRAPALQWVSSPIPRHWTLNPLARGRAGQEGGDEEAMMMMMTPSKHDLPLDPSATPAAAALVKHL